MAQVVTAGVPSVVVPRAFDQSYHGARIEALGLGLRVPWRRSSPRRLALALHEVLADEALGARCRAFAAGLAGADGVSAACDRVEAQLAGVG